MADQSGNITGAHRFLALAGGVMHMAIGFLVAVSSLVAPPWGVLVLWVVWIAASMWAIRAWRRHPLATFAAAGATIAFWVAFVSFGDLVLGWTA